jgi:hypothetical protein
MQGLRFGFFVFGAFWAAAKCAKHFASSSSLVLPALICEANQGRAKIINKEDLFILRRRPKNF